MKTRELVRFGTVGELDTFSGYRPGRVGDLKTETAGILPVPAGRRHGTPFRMFPTWLSPNLEISAVFIGALGPVLGLSATLSLVALGVGIVLGSLPVAYLSTWGPLTGTGQVPLARLPFGKGVVAPGLIQALSAIGWIAIGALFGAQAAHLLFHLPFWIAALLVVAATMAISVKGYEAALEAQKWGARIMPVLFGILTVRLIFFHHLALAHNTVHGAALAGTFVLFVTIAASGSFSWASYGADYSRYLPERSSRTAVFWWTLAGLVIAYAWLGGIGAIASSVLSSQTAAGLRDIMGGGFLGVVALAAIVFAAVVSSVLNDYSASLAFQSVSIRVKRPLLSAFTGIAAFVLVLWLNAGAATAARFQSLLLLTAYWCAPFVAIIAIDWVKHRARYTPEYVNGAFTWDKLRAGWPALVAFLAACGAMVPFMNTYYVYGPAAKAMNGADISYLVGIAVAGVLYWWLQRYATALPESAHQAVTETAVR
jgi:nucleobase:cation symporter-1, NCS1 family